jgi:hypothetical protein
MPMVTFMRRLRHWIRQRTRAVTNWQSEHQSQLATLDGDQLDAEKTRSEISKLRLEVQELRAWRSKLIFTAALSVLAPLGSILLFVIGWFGAHTADRIHQNDDLYNRAATQLASPDASVRLSAVTTLDHFAAPSKALGFASFAERVFSSKDSIAVAKERPRETMALLVGRLSVEDDQAVLNAIAAEVSKNPADSVIPLISMNKTAAVGFARAVGELSGLAILNTRLMKALNQDDLPDGGANDPSVTDVVNVVLRSGSPFEATARLNQQFSSRDFLTNRRCPFRELFKKQQRLSLYSDMSDLSRPSPPGATAVQRGLDQVVAAAAKLERSSYILGSLATSDWNVLASEDLYGTAVVVGDLNPGVIANLRSRGAYFQDPKDSADNPGCRILR